MVGLLGSAAYSASPPPGLRPTTTGGSPEVGGAGASISSSGGARIAAADVSTRLAGGDRYGTAAAVSQATFPQGAQLAYLATGSDYPDALAAAAAAGGRGPVLLSAQTGLPDATTAELRRLGATRVVVVGGLSAIPAAVTGAVQAALPGATVSRVAGPDRYSTAAALSSATFTRGASLAYLATGSDYPDALAAAAAGGGKAPVLLAAPTTVPATAAAELRRLGARNVIVIGGVSAVPDEIFSAWASADPAASFARVSGADRFATAAAVSAKTYAGGAKVAYLATGLDYPDALTSAAAAGGKGPVLLLQPDYAPSATLDEIRRLGVGQVVVVGGPSAIGDAAETQARQAAVPVAVVTPTARTGPGGSTIPGASTIPVSPSGSATPATNVVATGDSASTAVSVAMAQLGKLYVWGGSGPDSYDCSGLTAFAWRAAGVELPHNAAAQATLMAPVDVSSLQPGDLIFYDTPIDHVGLYVGGGQMIEAAHTGAPVRLADFRRPNLVGVGRPTQPVTPPPYNASSPVTTTQPPQPSGGAGPSGYAQSGGTNGSGGGQGTAP